MRHRFLPVAFQASFFVFQCSGSFAQYPSAPTIEILVVFDYPGDSVSTSPQKIDDRGNIVGTFIDGSAIERGFVRFRNGNFTPPIVEPNDPGLGTQARGLNNARTVCGYFFSDQIRGFFLSHNAYAEFDVPGAIDTFILDLNDTNNFVGAFDTSIEPFQAFISLGGSIVPFSVPGATTTIGYGINNLDQVVGQYTDSGSFFHGFFRDADGTLTFPIDPPGATSTFLFGLNDQGWMVGRFQDAAGASHGFLFRMPDKFLIYDFPGATVTSFNGINQKGRICGRYEDSGGLGHGIVARVKQVPAVTSRPQTTAPFLPAQPAAPPLMPTE